MSYSNEDLSNLRNQLLSSITVSDFQREILNYIWNQYLNGHSWPYSYKVHCEFDPEGDSVRKALIDIGGGAVGEYSVGKSNCRYILTPLGVVIASSGQMFIETVKLLKLLKERISQGIFSGSISSNEFYKDHMYSKSEAESLVSFSQLFLPYQFSSYCEKDDSCGIKFREEVDQLRSVSNESEYVFDLIMQKSDIKKPFLKEDREIYEKTIVYSPEKLNLGYDRLIRKKARFRSKLISYSLGAFLAFVTIIAWIPTLIPFKLIMNISAPLQITITIFCALLGMGLLAAPLKLRSKLEQTFYRRQTKKAILLAEEGSFEETMKSNRNLKILWQETKHIKD